MRRRVILGSVLAMALSGCTLPWSGPDPEPVAERAAAQLQEGRPGTAFGTGADKVWEDVAGDLGVTPTVKAVEVRTGAVLATDRETAIEVDLTEQIAGKAAPDTLPNSSDPFQNTKLQAI